MGTGEIIRLIIICLVVGGLIAATPYLFVKFTEPGWALLKTIIEFLFVGTILAAVLNSLNEPFLPLIITLIFSVFRYNSRVKKYKEIEESQ